MADGMRLERVGMRRGEVRERAGRRFSFQTSDEMGTFPTDTSDAKPGDLVMLISGRPAGIFNHVENQPDENPLRAVVEISQVEHGPLGIRHFLRWDRLVFGSTTPTYMAELSFDRSGHPRHDRLVAISKELEAVGRRVVIVDLKDGEVLTADLDRLARLLQSEGDSANITGK